MLRVVRSTKATARRRVGVAAVLLALTASLAPPTAASAAVAPDHPAWCRYRGSFGGLHYCPAVAEKIETTAYGTGRRVVLRDAIVNGASGDSVDFGWQRGPVCDEGTCDFYEVGFAVSWSGTHRPTTTGLLVDLYGTTTEGGITPVGYVAEGFCDDPYRFAC